MAGPTEAAALTRLHSRAARSCEPKQELQIEGDLLVRGIGAHRIGEVRDRSVDLTLRPARSGCAVREDPEERQRLRCTARIARTRNLLERILGASASALDRQRIVESQVELRRLDVALQRVAELHVVTDAEQRLRYAAEVRVRTPGCA